MKSVNLLMARILSGTHCSVQIPTPGAFLQYLKLRGKLYKRKRKRWSKWLKLTENYKTTGLVNIEGSPILAPQLLVIEGTVLTTTEPAVWHLRFPSRRKHSKPKCPSTQCRSIRKTSNQFNHGKNEANSAQKYGWKSSQKVSTFCLATVRNIK